MRPSLCSIGRWRVGRSEVRPTGYAPRDTLKPVAPDIWVADGPAIRFYGLPFPTRMVVIRLRNGDLFLHSPTAFGPSLGRELVALGRVRHLVSPNWIHYAGIPGWQAAFPDAVTWASPNVRARAAKRGVAVRFDRDLGDAPEAEWRGEIDQMIVRGSAVHQEVVFFHIASSTLILTDLIENFEPSSLPVWARPLARLGGVLAPRGGMPRDMRLTFCGGRGDLRAAVERMLAWAPERVIVAHGRWFAHDGADELRRAFAWLLV